MCPPSSELSSLLQHCVETIWGILLDKAGKPKKKGDQTPDKVATPVPSSVGVVDENGQTNQAVTNVLSGEDIDSLAVNIEELQKVWGIFLFLLLKCIQGKTVHYQMKN